MCVCPSALVVSCSLLVILLVFGCVLFVVRSLWLVVGCCVLCSRSLVVLFVHVLLLVVYRVLFVMSLCVARCASFVVFRCYSLLFIVGLMMGVACCGVRCLLIVASCVNRLLCFFFGVRWSSALVGCWFFVDCYLLFVV